MAHDLLSILVAIIASESTLAWEENSYSVY